MGFASPEGSNTRPIPLREPQYDDTDRKAVDARTLTVVVLLLLGSILEVVGVAFWIGWPPAAAILGLNMFVVALLLGNE